MTIKFRNRSGDLLVEVDSNTLTLSSFSRHDVVFHSCSVCGYVPIIGRDDGKWYCIGNDNCASCMGTYVFPDEGELADMSKRNK